MKKITWIGISIAVIAIAAAYYAGRGSNNSITNSDLTVYPVQCDDWFPLNYSLNHADDNSREPKGGARVFQNCLQRRALSRISLKVDKTSQQVIKWNIDDGSAPAFHKSNDCTIVDSNNWSCDNASSYPFGFNNGNYFENDFTHVIFVSKTQWDSINNGTPTPFGANL